MAPPVVTGNERPGRWIRGVRVLVIADLPTLSRREPLWDDQLTLLASLVDRAASMGQAARIALLVRDKSSKPDVQRVAELSALRELTATATVPLIINSRLDLAAAVNADGVQLPERGVSLGAAARAYPNLALGRSCHDRVGLEAANSQGAAWATLAPIFRPISTPEGKNPPMGLGGFRDAVDGLPMPVFGLGGITLSNCLEMDRFAAIGSLLLDQSPADALETMLQGRRAI